MAQRPLPPEKLSDQIDLQLDTSERIASFSLNHALADDGRFDDVGAAGEHLWYLRRLEPEAALGVPDPLRYERQSMDPSLLGTELLRLSWELGDEWAEDIGDVVATAPSVTFLLTYPHLRAGTLPLSFRTRPFFPSSSASRSMVTLVDGRWGQKIAGWAVRDGRYVVGLDKWYKEHKVPVGAYLVVQRGQEPEEVVVDIRPRRMRREWARMARVEGQRLVFEMRKVPIACEYDELMLVEALEADSVDELRRTLRERGVSMADVIAEVFPELLKLSPEGTVHAKTLYSAVNLIYRCPPGPIFAALASSSEFRPLGKGEWAKA